MEIVRLQESGSDIIQYDIDRIENYYKAVVIIGAILLGLGLIV
jgi:hypothetical protein